MDTKQILELPTHHRRTFIVLVLVVVGALALIDFTIVQDEATYIRTSVSGYIQSAIAAILVSLLVVLFVGVFIPPDRGSPGL